MDGKFRRQLEREGLKSKYIQKSKQISGNSDRVQDLLNCIKRLPIEIGIVS